MKLDEHIQNKLAATSDDEPVAHALGQVAQLLEEAGTSYAVIGSCGVQAHLGCFYRLPNDLDVVVPTEGLSRVVDAGATRGGTFVEQLGRGQLFVHGFPVHLIPPRMAVIDKDTNRVFTSVDLSTELACAVARSMVFPGTPETPRLHVASLEAILFVEFVRPIYTGSVTSIALALREQQLDVRRFARFYRDNPDLRSIIRGRLAELPAAVERLVILDADSRAAVIQRLGYLGTALQEACRPGAPA